MSQLKHKQRHAKLLYTSKHATLAYTILLPCDLKYMR